MWSVREGEWERVGHREVKERIWAERGVGERYLREKSRKSVSERERIFFYFMDLVSAQNRSNVDDSDPQESSPLLL